MNVKSTSLILIVAVLSVMAGSWFSSSQKLEKEQEKEREIQAARDKFSVIKGLILSPPRKIGIPELLKDDGSSFVSADLQGHWSIIFFGFTHCSEVCPVTMGKLAQAKKQAKAQGIDFPQVYLVSIDPARDDLASLKTFVEGFDKDFVGIAGNEGAIKALSLQMSVVYMLAEETVSTENYQVDHSSALLLMNPEGSLKAILNSPHTPDKILKDIKTVISSVEKK